MTAPKLCAILGVVCLLPACSNDSGFQGGSPSAYQSVSCPSENIAAFPQVDIPRDVECGYLTVLESRAKPDGRRIRIFVMRAPAQSPARRSDPIVYLSGGPGGAGSFEVAAMVGHGLNANRDVIFVDQRGTHRADPRLRCNAWDRFIFDAVSLPFAADSTSAAENVTIKACRDELTAAGYDVAAYNTTENAADIAELRTALGIEQWNVYGVSYGSKLALTVLRDHPQGIRSVVLDSVSPPNNNIVEVWWTAPATLFRQVFAACAAQPSCAAAYPNLEADFYAAVKRLDQTPAVVQRSDESGQPVAVNIDGFSFAYTLIMISERSSVAGIPRLMNDTAKGSYEAIADAYLATRGPSAFIGLTGAGLAFTIFCAEHANLTTEAATLAASKAALPAFPERVLKVQPKQGRLFSQCPIWDVPKAAPSVGARTVSDVPVLIIEGSMDAATAPRWVDLVTPGLRNSQVVRFPHTGHSVLGKSACALSLMSAFLDDPNRAVDSACVAETLVTFETQ